MFRMLGFARAVVLAAVAAVGAFETRVAEACSPGGLRVNLLAPNLRDPTPTRAVFWFSLTGADYGTVDFDLAPEILAPDGFAAPLVVSSAVMSSRQDGPGILDRRVRVEATLEPNTAYSLTYNTPPPTPYGGEITRVTRAFTTGAPAALDRPASPTVFLAFAAGEPDERLPLPCTYEESYEVTVIMVSAPSARAIHARMRYADETGFSHAITHVVPEGATGATLFAWAQDRGLPCVEVVVEGGDGSRTDPTVVCQAVGCVEGEEWSAAVGRSVEWWREEYGPGSCSAVESAASARSCACVAMAQAHSAAVSVIAGLMVVLVFLRRPKRRSGSAVSVFSCLLIGCASSLEPEEVVLEAVRGPIAERIELEAGAPPLDLQLSLLAAESRLDRVGMLWSVLRLPSQPRAPQLCVLCEDVEIESSSTST